MRPIKGERESGVAGVIGAGGGGDGSSVAVAAAAPRRVLCAEARAARMRGCGIATERRSWCTFVFRLHPVSQNAYPPVSRRPRL